MKVHQISVAVLVRHGRVLLCHRHPDRQWYPDVWDFPGGHVEADETPAVAVGREVREELGVDIDPPVTALERWTSDDEDMTFFLVRHWAGTPRNLAPEEHDDIGWFTLAEALDRKLPDSRYPDLLRKVLPPD